MFVFFLDKIDIESLTMGSPTCPPHALMLEWTVDVSGWYNTLYPCCKPGGGGGVILLSKGLLTDEVGVSFSSVSSLTP